MANDKTALGFEVPGFVINSYKDLQSAIKSAKEAQVDAALKFGEGSKKYLDASKNISTLKSKLDDLNTTTKSVSGSGIEKLNNGISLFKEGIGNADFGKINAGLKGLGSAFKAIPIFLIVEGIRYLYENFDKLSKGSGILAKALRFVADIIGVAIDLIYEFTDAIGLTNSALDKMGESIADNATKANEALAAQTKEFDRQMKAAKLAGKSTLEIEQAKQQAIIDTNKLIVEQIIAFVRAGGELDDEKKKMLTASLDFIKDARLEQKSIEVNHNKEVNDIYLKAAEERKRLKEIEIAQDLAALKELEKAGEEFFAKEAELKQKQLELDQAIADENERRNQLNHEADLARMERTRLENEETARLKSEQDQQVASAAIESAKISADSQAQLVNFLYDLKRSKLQKGSAEELKAAKRQFQINKALAIQSSIISGIQGVINALSAQSVIPEPYGTILKVATAVGVGIAATVNTAKIASQQFNEGGGGGGDSAASTGNIGSAASAPPPTMVSPQNTPPSTTSFDDKGKNLSIKVEAEVVETKMTEQQERQQRFKSQSTF